MPVIRNLAPYSNNEDEYEYVEDVHTRQYILVSNKSTYVVS